MTKEIYVDSSVILAVLFEEATSPPYRRLLYQHQKHILSSSLLEAEVYAAAKRENVPLEKAAAFIELVSLVFPEASLQREYLRVFQQGYIRGADAYHVATALYLDPQAKDLVFATTDRIQANAVKALGFRRYHA